MNITHPHIATITLLVDDYDQAITYYCQVLGFTLLEDTQLSDNKRWVRVAPHADNQTALVLAKANTQEQLDSLGNQAGGRVLLLLQTDDFQRDYQRMQAAGVTFTEAPRDESYGTVAVFKDWYGNLWDLIQRK
ncbi:MAG: VOC family protein [Xanthomonadales bacterium]|jgi:uncharacterized glyoxalase superfamily protein PhnB|nr:VOC family protein [Xanthomonadales bacterium]